jgi:hypothetical protein
LVKFNRCACPLEHLHLKKYKVIIHYSKEENFILILGRPRNKILKSYCTPIAKQKVEDHVNFLLQEEW